MAAWTFGQKILAGFSVAGVVLLFVAFMGYANAQRLVENARWTAHTQDVRREISDLRTVAHELDSEVRGFVLTGREGFLASHAESLARMEKNYATLRRLTSDNPEQQRRMQALRPLLDRKMVVNNEYIGVRRAQGSNLNSASLPIAEKEENTAAIRTVLDAMESEETHLYGVRQAETDSSAALTKAVIFWGSVVGAVLVGLMGFMISQSLARQVGSAVRHIQSSSAELQAAANQQATGAREQATAMSEITTTISELLTTSKQIAESSQRVAAIATDTRSAAQAGDQLVQRTSDSIGGLRRQIDTVVTHMLDLGRKSQQIGGILEIINELAEQTNILAINATIEAAGAGDAGKRFGVVADEVRRLADRVAGSTREIRSLIDEVRAAVNTTVMATEGGTKAVEAGARSFTDAAQAFAQIVALVSTTSEAAREIELSTKQQSTAVEQVNQAAASVAQATKENEASSSQTLQTASQLAGLSRELLRAVQSGTAA